MRFSAYDLTKLSQIMLIKYKIINSLGISRLIAYYDAFILKTEKHE